MCYRNKIKNYKKQENVDTYILVKNSSSSK